jgi:hypothetical protein
MPIDADGPRIAREPGHDGKRVGDMAILSARGDVNGLDSTCERRRHLSAAGLVLLLPEQDHAIPKTNFDVVFALNRNRVADDACSGTRAGRGRLQRTQIAADAATGIESPRGTNGYYVVNAKWSPDSQFFVYSMASSGGHSPWSFPMMVYSRQSKRIVEFSDMIEGKPTISADFHLVGPHTLVASTWKAPGALDDKVPVKVDLRDAFAKLPESSD